ncbi:hypothetical protein [Halomonas denitrificans]|uniref:hypothetical protein n=1 Tax=Halomonas denitrificans TaxID=370769 RepID=UPI000D34A0DA|nr:hypothetical protein [Halomonas denitrificans]
MTSRTASSPPRHQVIVTSPGDVTPAALRAVAEGLARPVAEVADAIFRAPTVLVDDLDADTATALDRLLASLGLESRVSPHGEALADDASLDVAVQVLDVTHIATVTESLAAFLGVSTQRAFGLLATPPGVVLGGVGAAAVESLARRLGEGARVTRAQSDAGPFDLHLAPGASVPAWLQSRLRDKRLTVQPGWCPLDLSYAEARSLWSALGREGGIRLVNRALMRWDLVLTAEAPPTREALAWLEARFTIPPEVAPRVLAHPPLALAEACDAAEARRCLEEARALGLSVEREPSGFGRAGIELMAVTDTARLRAVLARFDLSEPVRLPSRIVDDLSDLEARVLAHELAAVGARTRFVEAAPTSGDHT